MSAEEVRNAVKDLNDLDDFVKLEAENTIAMNMPEEISVLHEELLKPYHKTIKISLIDIVKSFKDPDSIPVFIELLFDDNKWVRRHSSTALADYGSEAVPQLTEVTKSDNWRARGGAIWALSKIADPSSLDVLIEASKDEKSYVRSGTIYGLAAIGGDKAIETLEYMAENEETGYAKANAIAALEELKGE
ncbi:MAG: HEAT repeat domain-containing protein [Methanosphaera stadtmanae]|nr:HEAT repeat domain-containing protein [Methanosphaera stadtmanae]